MAEHPNATAVRRMIDALNSGDMQAMAGSLSDDVIWHEIGNPEPVRGKAALAARMSGGSLGEYKFSSETHDIVANDEHAVALMTTTVKHGDASITYRTAEIFHVKDGVITERWAFSDDTDAIVKFFS